MSAILITILILAIFIGAICYIINAFVPEPFKKWAWGVLVVLVAIALIDMLSGGNMLGIGHWRVAR